MDTSGVHLEPYEEFHGTRLPDPRKAFVADIALAVAKIIEAEGPMTVRRVIDRYRVAIGLGYIKGQTREALLAAVGVAVRKGLARSVEQDDDPLCEVLASPQGPDVRVRERGPRSTEDIPKNEIAELARGLGLESAKAAPAFRKILAVYNLKRLTEQTEDRLRRALDILRQPH